MTKSLLPHAATPRQREIVRAYEKAGNYAKAAKIVGIHPANIQRTIERVARLGDAAVPSSNSTDDLVVNYSGDDGTISYIGPKFRDADELLEYVDIDRSIWDIASIEINNWEVSGKRKLGLDKNGKPQAEQIWKTGNLQIKVKLRRKAPKHVQDALKAILSKAPTWRGKLAKPRFTRDANHLVELSLYDSHFGKLCWGKETGTSYNLDIAYADYVGAAEDMLDQLGNRQIEKIVLPVGHDFFQVDNWQGTTARGTLVDSTDDRFSKVFEVGYNAVQHVIKLCRDVAPVEIIWVPGNHDPATSWYLCETLRRVFEGDRYVTVDNSPRKRKYKLYGVNLIGYDHGETTAQSELPLLMANEVPDLWAQSFYRSWRIGHWHKKKKMKWVDVDTYKGVEVNTIPSISGTDRWHFEHAFVGSIRAAEVAIWNKETGPAGTFPVEARSATAARREKRFSQN